MSKQKIQGEGDYEATRRYRKRTDDFLNNNDVEKAAVRAAPTSAREAEDMHAAEAAGKRRAKGEDPALRQRAAPRVEPSTRGKTSRR
ncbi:MAG TPA: hypothetical protein VFS58_16365 [Steroidobacteraceae bacterium]|nr:hypothetical protein [Steroidobacteraceae bacterium]